jgi:hypothetical protein
MSFNLYYSLPQSRQILTVMYCTNWWARECVQKLLCDTNAEQKTKVQLHIQKLKAYNFPFNKLINIKNNSKYELDLTNAL